MHSLQPSYALEKISRRQNPHTKLIRSRKIPKVVGDDGVAISRHCHLQKQIVFCVSKIGTPKIMNRLMPANAAKVIEKVAHVGLAEV